MGLLQTPGLQNQWNLLADGSFEIICNTPSWGWGWGWGWRMCWFWGCWRLWLGLVLGTWNWGWWLWLVVGLGLRINLNFQTMLQKGLNSFTIFPFKFSTKKTSSEFLNQLSIDLQSSKWKKNFPWQIKTVVLKNLEIQQIPFSKWTDTYIIFLQP